MCDWTSYIRTRRIEIDASAIFGTSTPFASSLRSRTQRASAFPVAACCDSDINM